jgi:hypothetical protein
MYGSAQAIDISGFVKNFFIVQKIPQYKSMPGATEPPPGGQALIANNLRTRVDVSGSPSPWMDVFLSYNFVPRLQDDDFASINDFIQEGGSTTYRVADLEPFLYPSDPDSTDNFVILQNLDRAYVAFAAPSFDLYLGRQAVAWGSARSVNPTDVIAPFLYTEFDTENRSGVDAARLRVPTGALGEADVGYVAGEDFRDEYSAYYGRTKHYLWNTDMSLLLMRFRTNWLAGVDVTRAIGGTGFWFEGAYVHNSDASRSQAPAAGTKYDIAGYTRISTGVDYSLGGGTYLYLEYHFNGAGGSDPDDYRFLAGTSAYIDGAVYLFGQHYVIPGIMWPFYIAAAAFVALGAAPTWDPVPGGDPVVGNGVILDPFSTQFASEFGAYPDTYYIEVRYYY